MQDHHDMDVALVKYRVAAVHTQLSTVVEQHRSPCTVYVHSWCIS